MMTSEEHEKLAKAREEFWIEFSELCNRHIEKAPSHLVAEYVMTLGEVTSIYGRKK